jgi:L-seryl-tRNA(Ser) seleniumtransferase
LAVVLRAPGAKARGRRLAALGQHLRQLPIPVLGHIRDDALRLDMRGLDDCALFLDQLSQLQWGDRP